MFSIYELTILAVFQNYNGMTDILKLPINLETRFEFPVFDIFLASVIIIICDNTLHV